MKLKTLVLKVWWGRSFATLEYAGMKGWLPKKLQRTDKYEIGCRPYNIYDESFEIIRWN